MDKLTIRDVDFNGKKVFCRVDFNVPIDENGRIGDDTRIRAALPTIRHIIENGGRLILASHLGRPKGTVKPEFSLKPVATRLGELLDLKVAMAPDCIGPAVREQVDAMRNGDVLLLENVRFHAGETDNDPGFSSELAGLADLYVNDAFGTAHRAHASTEGAARILQPAVAGLLIEKEIRYLGQVLSAPERPFVAIIGGAKVSDKIEVIENLLGQVDALLIGGGMAYTFLKAKGVEVGNSLVETDRLDLSKELMEKAETRGVKLLLPTDHVIADEFSKDAKPGRCSGDIPTGTMALDIGDETIEAYSRTIKSAATVLWNGPMGVFEFDAFSRGTFAIARALADSNAISIIGGGDSVAAVQKAGLTAQMTHISTGGGASLEYLEGKELPGIAALSDKK
ncbi:MAG: phosphoglycerate kinase [Desulfuromonadales bacterium]|nr:phosphoglycerate kinase [Desulfuromonadales bacterium]NIR33121.1 phosphoglycerate kinase [Desulfuromonadales bacterium]NIS39359.1 phosphoglycerate kinase [Desulfuromonadales bacterium]